MGKAAKPPTKVDGEKPSVAPFETVATAAFGSENGPSALRLLNQIFDATRVGPESDANLQGMLAVVGTIKALKPRNAIERMLVTQMMATHEQAMECLRRATLANQTSEGRDLNLKHAGKFSQLYVRQMEALDKHRGKGQQKITVEHVTVEAGGQAIVGNVETAPKSKRTKPPAPALEHKLDVSVPLEQALGSRNERVSVSAKTRGMDRTGD